MTLQIIYSGLRLSHVLQYKGDYTSGSVFHFDHLESGACIIHCVTSSAICDVNT